ncbi:MAG: endo alpha-1,4 polygalactosaminidase [Anaerolineales bacterium]
MHRLWETRASGAVLALGFVLGRLSLAGPESAASGAWQPSLHTSWQWQMTTPLDLTVEAEMWIVDLFDDGRGVVAELHGEGRRTVCAVSAGVWENWRSDADRFPESVRGNRTGWNGERYLDIRRIDVLGPMLEARMDLCRKKGHDGIVFENVDGYQNDSGFPLTYQEQLAYNRFLAEGARARGLSVGLENDLEQIPDLLDDFDWALNEQCFEHGECAGLRAFVEAGKAVFHVEYALERWEFCPQATTMSFNSMRKRPALGPWRRPCRPDGTATATPVAPGTATETAANTGTPSPSAMPTREASRTPASPPSAIPLASDAPLPSATAEPSNPPTATPTASRTPTRTPTASSTPRPPTATPIATTPAAPSPIWKPSLRTTWQWQLTGALDLSVTAEMWDIDLFDNSATVVSALHALGAKVVCYMSAGSWEDWRPDAADFPDSVKGRSNGWPGERWLDVRQLDVLGPIMEARLDRCAGMGFDGAEFDNVDGYANSTGFPLTFQDQIRYNTFLAEAAHARGLAAALKNDVEQVPDLVAVFDFAINEECFRYGECKALSAFVQAGKPVFHVEYDLAVANFCPQANSMSFNSMRKHLDLDAWRETCW